MSDCSTCGSKDQGNNWCCHNEPEEQRQLDAFYENPLRSLQYDGDLSVDVAIVGQLKREGLWAFNGDAVGCVRNMIGAAVDAAREETADEIDRLTARVKELEGGIFEGASVRLTDDTVDQVLERIPAVKAKHDRLTAERDRLRELLALFVESYESESCKAVFMMAASHGYEYRGPIAPLDEARQALKDKQ